MLHSRCRISAASRRLQVAADDADEEHHSALEGLVGGGGGYDTAQATGEDDLAQSIGRAMDESEPFRTPRGPAFQID